MRAKTPPGRQYEQERRDIPIAELVNLGSDEPTMKASIRAGIDLHAATASAALRTLPVGQAAVLVASSQPTPRRSPAATLPR